MYSEEIRSVDLSLATLAGEVDPASWEVIRKARMNLASLADQLEAAEQNLVVPEVDGKKDD